MNLTFRSFATVSVAALAALSLAAPKVTLDIEAYASSSRPMGPYQNDDKHHYVGSSTLIASANANASGGGTGFGHAEGIVGFGLIHGLVSDSTTYGSAIPFVTNSSSGFGTIDGIYEDTITIKSATLPFGTPVALKQTLHAHGILTRSGFYSTSFYLALAGGFGLTTNIGVSQSINQNDIATQLIIQQDIIRTVMVHVGDVLPVFGELNVIAVSTSSPNQPFGASQVNGLQTAGQMLSITTPGAYFTSASGAQYAAVPEPGSVAVLAIGLIGILRRRKK